jgi:Ribonuclease G/E
VSAISIWTDAAIGETRQVHVLDGRPFALAIWRWSDRGRRARWGEVYHARVRTVDTRRRGAFLDLGIEEPGFVRLDSGGMASVGAIRQALVEGQAVRAHVRREGARGKAPVMSFEAIATTPERLGCVARHEAEGEAELQGAADSDTREHIDALVDAALARTAPVPGGGSLTIEQTAALVAIDVDAGDRGGSGDAERFAAALNVDAAREAMRQLRLRNLGGIVAIDFVSMRDKRNRAQVMDVLRSEASRDPWGVQMAPMSRFGVVELSRGQLCRPLAEVLCGADGAPSAETEALVMLRRMEREASVGRGRPVIAVAGAETRAWLDAAIIDWRTALSARIGPLWELREGPNLPPRAWRVELA